MSNPVYAKALSNIPPLPIANHHQIQCISSSGQVNGILRWFTPTINIGTAISYSGSVTNGDAFLINEVGVYAIDYTFVPNGNNPYNMQIVKNSNGTTVSDAGCLMHAGQPTTNNSTNAFSHCSWVGVLNLGDIIRATEAGSGPTTGGGACKFNIAKITN